MVPGCCLARRNAAKGIRLVKESEAVPSVNQTTSANAQGNLTTVNETSSEATRPVPKPRRSVASPLSSPLQSPLPSPLPTQLPSPLPSPRPTPRKTSESPQPSTKDSSLESSSDEEDEYSEQNKPQPPPPREASFGPTKQTALPGKEKPAVEKKVFRVCLDYEAVALGAVSLIKGQEIQVMPRPDNNGWMEVKVDGKKGFAPKECIEATMKLAPRKARGKPKCDLKDIEDAYWAGDASEGERVLHSTQTEGTFMIRKSQSKENQETLLVYEDGRILKYKIKHKQGSGYALSKTDPIFESFDELVFFYSLNFLPKAASKLQLPYQRVINTK